MRFMVDRELFKGALVGVSSIAKKSGMSSIVAGEPLLGIVRDSDGAYKVAACSDELSVMAPLPGVEVVGAADTDGGLVPYDGRPPLSPSSVIGIVDCDKLVTVVKKLPKGEQRVDMEYAPASKGSSAMKLTVRCGTGEYEFACREPHRLCSLFGSLSSQMTDVCTLRPDDASALMGECAYIGGLLPDSMSQPAFACVCLSSEPDSEGGGSHLRLSGTSNTDGFSTMSDMEGVMVSQPFTALIQRKTASALKSLDSQLADDGWSTLSVEYEAAPDGTVMERASRIRLANGKYTVWVRCVSADFPFASLRTLVRSVSLPDIRMTLPGREFSDALSRVTALAAGESPVTGFEFFDGGAVRMSQGGEGGIAHPVAVERIELEDGSYSFAAPGDAAMAVDTDTVCKLIKEYAGCKEMRLFVTKARGQMGGKFCIGSGECPGSGTTSILIERR